MIRFRIYLVPGLMCVAGSGCITVNSPLFPCAPAPIVLDRGCPQVMGSLQSAPAPIPMSPPYAPSIERVPTATPDEPATLPGSLLIPRLGPPEPASTGGGRLRTGLAGR